MSEKKQINVLGRYIIGKIISEEWKEHDKIPSEGFFEIKFSISNAIVKKTINKLVKINLLYSKERLGTFVQTNKLRTLFKRESKTDGCSTFTSFKTNISNFFSFDEIFVKNRSNITAQNAFKNVKTPKNIFTYRKMYINEKDKTNIKKISYALINKELVHEETFSIDIPFHENLLEPNNFPYTRISFMIFEKNYPEEVKKILNLKNDEDILIKYIVLLNINNIVIHAAKFFIRKDDFFSISVKSM